MCAPKNIHVAFIPCAHFLPKMVYPCHYDHYGKSDLKIFESALAGSGIDVRIRNWYY